MYMYGMFEGANSFNQPLNKWYVSNVTEMGWMFYNASSFMPAATADRVLVARASTTV